MNKKNLILGIASSAIGATVIIAPSVAVTRQNRNKDQEDILKNQEILKNEFDKIIKLDLTNLALTSLPSLVTNENIGQYIVVPKPINEVIFFLRLLSPNKFNDENGTISVVLVATRNNETLTKEIEVVGFKSLNEQQGILAILQSELDLINSIKTKPLASSILPSSANPINVNEYLITPNPIAKEVIFTLKNPSNFNDATGSLEIVLLATKDGISLEKKFIVSGFKILISVEQIKEEIKIELDKIGNIPLKPAAANILASSVTNENIDQYLITPDAINGISFQLKVSNPFDSDNNNGSLSIVLIGIKNNVSNEKTFKIDGFLKTIISEFNKITTLSINQNASNILPSLPTDQNLSSFINVPRSILGVNFFVSIANNTSFNNLEGTLDVLLTASQAGQVSVSKVIKTSGWYTSIALFKSFNQSIVPNNSLEVLKNWLFTGQVGARNFENLVRQNYLDKELSQIDENKSINSLLETQISIRNVSIENHDINSPSLDINFDASGNGWTLKNQTDGSNTTFTKGVYGLRSFKNLLVVTDANLEELGLVKETKLVNDALTMRQNQLGGSHIRPPYFVTTFNLKQNATTQQTANFFKSSWIVYLSNNSASFFTNEFMFGNTDIAITPTLGNAFSPNHKPISSFTLFGKEYYGI
ncbi:lipoprotein 17-related variable surface protein [[Mycoplasma] mobile]|uniref:Variable surface protein mvspD n=1 Tax=Mycoplasma mobile (strain ATCC 43663 / 163K / NCTC 11711) TaxID=267748 RepID=Q6KHW2_MYCM1|nr:lipoprotein 17-related variable surface protein [[Mycoplasma] mobile]AAT27814.1 variable surface protein mvspD [Mycoplasma mobile 163K]